MTVKPYYADDSVTLQHGDALDVLRSLPNASVDAVVTDPPYGLEFMGREWDSFKPSAARLRTRVDGRTNPAEGKSVTTTPEAYVAGAPFQQWCQQWATECLRVLKPGGHLLAFGGTRTVHRLTSGIEDAGFEIRDGIDWLYGSGFPKSLNVGDGRGTALKPAREPIVMARKPLAGTVAANVLAYGTGALNIDATRVPGGKRSPGFTASLGQSDTSGSMAGGALARINMDETQGRWPSNVVLSHSEWCEVCECGARGPHEASDYCYDVQLDCPPGCPVAELDRQSGVRPAGGSLVGTEPSRPFGTCYGDMNGRREWQSYGDSGGASRFFPVFRYEAKAPTAERPRTADGTAHPTVKPLDLMRWLVRLVTPAGGVVLEPFAGSGTTAEACVLEGFRCIAIERDETYLPLIVARLSKPLQPALDFGDAA